MWHPTGFSTYQTNDLPDIANDDDDTEIEMYADDTTIYTNTRLNEMLCKFSSWCGLNFLPHPEKTEFISMRNKSFIGHLRGIMLKKSYIRQVLSTRCPGMEPDDELKWFEHVSELTRSYS